MTIQQPRLVTVEPRRLNKRLWLLVEREILGTLTATERAELDVLCAALETDQDNQR